MLLIGWAVMFGYVVGAAVGLYAGKLIADILFPIVRFDEYGRVID